MMTRASWLLVAVLVLAAGVFAGCGDSGADDDRPTPDTIVVVADPVLRSAERGVKADVADTFAAAAKGGKIASGPTTTCVGLVGTDREFRCSTTVKVQAGTGARCQVIELRQDWDGRVSAGAHASWAKMGGVRTVSRVGCG